MILEGDLHPSQVALLGLCGDLISFTPLPAKTTFLLELLLGDTLSIIIIILLWL